MNKKNWKTEIEKLKQMSMGDRIWYLWEYYKIPFFAILAAIFLFFELGACIYRNLQDTMLYCVTVNETGVVSADFSVVQTEFEARNGIDQTWRQDTVFDCSLSVDDSNQEIYDQYYNTASNIKLTSLLATDTIDVMITTSPMFSYYSRQNVFLDLSSFLSEDLYQRLEEENRILTEYDADGQSFPCGILLKDSYLSDLLDLEDNSSISVCTDQNHSDIVLKFIVYVIWGE